MSHRTRGYLATEFIGHRGRRPSERPLMSATSIIELTPLGQMRKKRPSYSPVKCTEPASLIRRQSASDSLAKKPAKQDGLDVGLEGANLVFKEFSFTTEDGRFHQISRKHLVALRQYLDSKYGVSELMASGIFLIITCRGKVPPSDQTICNRRAHWCMVGRRRCFPLGYSSPSSGSRRRPRTT